MRPQDYHSVAKMDSREEEPTESENKPLSLRSARREVIAWYGRKTESILKKYGPGPRVHFHVGLFDGLLSTDDSTVEVQRQKLIASQELLMKHAAQFWDARSCLSGSVLDVGCGLGGGAIFWAQEFHADVTAITIVPEHVPLVAIFAEQADVSSLVHPLLTDACDVKTPRRFDAAVAFESSCYLDRKQWFGHLSTILRSGGYVCIEDSFLAEPQWAKPFNTYWRTRIGTLDEYLNAAQTAGFALDMSEDITAGVAEFWRQSNIWSEMTLNAGKVPDDEEWRLQQSVRWQTTCFDAWKRRGIHTYLLRFRLTG